MHRNEDWPVFHKIVPIITVFEQNGRTRPLIGSSEVLGQTTKMGLPKGYLKISCLQSYHSLGQNIHLLCFF